MLNILPSFHVNSHNFRAEYHYSDILRNNEVYTGLNSFLVFFLSRFSDVGCFYEIRQEFKCIMF